MATGGAGGRVASVAVRAFGWSVVALAAGAGCSRLTAGEPVDASRGLALLAALGVLAAAGFVAVALALTIGDRVLPFAAPVVLVGGMAAAVMAEPLHWRWSRADFAAVADGTDVRCAPATDCRLGWWRVSGSDRYDDMVVVWLRDGACDAGNALGMPLEGAPDVDAVAATARRIDGPTDLVTVEPWRDGWYELCYLS